MSGVASRMWPLNSRWDVAQSNAITCAFGASAEVDDNGEPLWLGAATFDTRVEISRTTGGITHRIAPDVDSERNKLVKDTDEVRSLDGVYWIDNFHEAREGRNGGGDPYYTDGRLAVGVITIRRQ